MMKYFIIFILFGSLKSYANECWNVFSRLGSRVENNSASDLKILSKQLHQATLRGDIYTVKDLLEEGADVDSQSQEGWTPLMIASYHGQVRAVKFLIHEGADINLSDKYKRTALMYASDRNHNDIVDILKSAGAN